MFWSLSWCVALFVGHQALIASSCIHVAGVDGWKDVLGFEELGVRVAGKCNKKLPKKLGLMFG